jgi:hypothetical protein
VRLASHSLCRALGTTRDLQRAHPAVACIL